MWRLRTPQTPAMLLRRHLKLLAATLIVAAFATISLGQTALAVDAVWDGDTLTYDGKTFLPTTTPPDEAGMPHEYEAIDTNTALVIYFDDSQRDPQANTSARLITYDFPGYSNPRPQTITVTRNLAGEERTDATGLTGTCSSEATQGVGWVICPLSYWLSEGVDALYGIIEDFLEVNTINDDQSGIYPLWDLVRTLANICFVIVFIVIIYSQITGLGYSNHNLKDMIPRLVVAATLVNLSFLISALLVDTSNLLGHSINAILVNIRENYSYGPDVGNISWGDATGYVLSGGTVAIAGFAAAAGGSFSALGLLILASLVSAGMAVLVAFVILAARQALITMLVVISPLAFVAYVLPNTRSLFDKWRKSFTTLLVFFPIFALLFGGSQLAGVAIMNNADGQMHVVLIGLATQVVPLVITPLLIRFSTGLLGQVANMANNKSRGLSDRLRNSLHDRADTLATEKRADWAKMAVDGRGRRFANPVAMLGARMDQGRREREKRKGLAEDYLGHRADLNWNRHINEGTGRTDRRRHQMYEASHAAHKESEIHKGRVDDMADQHWNTFLTSTAGAGLREHRRQATIAREAADTLDKSMTAEDKLLAARHIRNTGHLQAAAINTGIDTKEAALLQANTDATVDEQWANLQNSNVRGLRNIRTNTDLAKNRAKAIEDGMSAADQRTFDRLVNEDAGYLHIRRAKEQAIRDTKHAQFQASEVEAAGERAFQADFEDGAPGSRELRQQNIRIEQMKKESATIASTLQKRADAHWERVSRTQDDLQTLRLNEVKATDSQHLAETEWNTFVENARALGDAAPGLAPANKGTAKQLKNLYQDTAVQESALREAKERQAQDLALAYRDSEETGDRRMLERAAGIGGRDGEVRAYSKAWKQLNAQLGEDIDTAKSITSRYSRAQLKDIMFYGKDPSDPNGEATVALRQAAMYALLQDKGNNQDAQEIRGAIAKKGLIQHENGRYYEAKRDDKGNLVLNDSGYPKPDMDNEVTDKKTIRDRRDWTQFFDDAMSKSPHKMVTYSGTDKSDARSGALVSDMRSGYIRDALGGKFGPDKMLQADIDELKSFYFDMVDPDGYYQSLSPKQQEKVNETLQSSIIRLQQDKQLSGRIDDRNRGMMNNILNQIDDRYAIGTEIGPDGKPRPIYPVDDNKAIIPPDKRSGMNLDPTAMTSEEKFAAPVNVKPPDPSKRDKDYYTDREIKNL